MNSFSATAPFARKRRPWVRYLMLALLIVPILETFVIIQVGRTTGGWNTFALLLFWSALGAWLVKRESGRAFGALKQAFSSGRMPARELADAALVLIGGTLLLAPGFITDALGLFFLLPFTRPITRKILEKAVQARLFGAVPGLRVFSGADFESVGAGRFRARSNDGGERLRTEDVYGASPYPYPHEHHASGYGTTTHSTTSRRSSDIVEGEIID